MEKFIYQIILNNVFKMRSKTLYSFIVLSFAVLFLLSPLVSAQSAAETFGNFITGVIDGIQRGGQPVFSALLGTTDSGSDLFVKVLYAIIVTLIVVAVLDTVSVFSGREWLQTIIGIAVSLIGIRFLPPELIELLAIPSSALVAALVVGVPFFIFGYVIQKAENQFIRRAGWVVYAVMLAILWGYNLTNPWHWIYPAFVAACIIAFFIDGTLQKFMGKLSAERSIGSAARKQSLILGGQLAELQGAMANATTNKQRSKIKEKMDEIKENMEELG